MKTHRSPGFNVYEQVDGAADALLAEAEWTHGIEVSEASHDWNVGQHFDKPVPVRQPKPPLWSRIIAWFKAPDPDMQMEAEVFRGLTINQKLHRSFWGPKP